MKSNTKKYVYQTQIVKKPIAKNISFYLFISEHYILNEHQKTLMIYSTNFTLTFSEHMKYIQQYTPLTHFTP